MLLKVVEVAEVDVNEVVEGDGVNTKNVVVGVDEEDKISNLEWVLVECKLYIKCK